MVSTRLTVIQLLQGLCQRKTAFLKVAFLLHFGLMIAGAQAIQVERIGRPVMARFFPEVEKIVRVYEDHIIIVNPEGTVRDSIHTPGIGSFALNHNVQLAAGQIIFTKKGSGLVYQLTAGKLKRIDRSMDHNFQQEALEFVRHDTIFRHGGRGFWDAHNLLIFFSFDTFEWEVVRPLKGDRPPGLYAHHGLISGKDIYMYGGFSINPANPAQQLFNEEVWKFHFPNRTWTRLGKLNPDEILPTLKEFEWRAVGSTTAVSGPARYYSKHQWLFRFDPGENEVKFYSAIPRMAKLVPYQFLDYFIYKDHFYQYASENMHLRKGSEQLYALYKVPLNQFLNNPEKVLKIYISENKISWIWSLLVLPLIMVPWSLIRAQKPKMVNKTKAILTSNGISYHSTEYALSPVALSVLTLLLSREIDVPSAEIMELTSKPGLDYPNQVRLKNQVIRSLNLELRSIFRTNEELILQTSSAVDRRIKCYCIDRTWFEDIKKV